MLINGIEIEEYFRYHPPTTEDRKQKHQAVNDAALKFCRALLKAGNPRKPEVQTAQSRFLEVMLESVDDKTCSKWAVVAIRRACEQCEDKEAVLMYTQQARMFLNQGVTIDDLKVQSPT